MLFRITRSGKVNDMVDPFKADNEEEAAQKALEILGFGYGARDRIEEEGPVATLDWVGYELEIVG